MSALMLSRESRSTVEDSGFPKGGPFYGSVCLWCRYKPRVGHHLTAASRPPDAIGTNPRPRLIEATQSAFPPEFRLQLRVETLLCVTWNWRPYYASVGPTVNLRDRP